MSKSHTRRRVVKSFLAGKADRAGAFTTDGKRLYSYSWALAELDDTGKPVALPKLSEGSSRTTSEHQSYARLAVADPEYFR